MKIHDFQLEGNWDETRMDKLSNLGEWGKALDPKELTCGLRFLKVVIKGWRGVWGKKNTPPRRGVFFPHLVDLNKVALR